MLISFLINLEFCRKIYNFDCGLPNIPILLFFYLGGGHKTYFFSGGCCQISI
jgi:hypothetical protein